MQTLFPPELYSPLLLNNYDTLIYDYSKFSLCLFIFPFIGSAILSGASIPILSQVDAFII